MSTRAIHKGDVIRIECEGIRTTAQVLMASSNSLSLMLGFDAVLDGHAGMMPVLRDDGGVYRSIVTGCEVKIL
jgi:hypothetical protein